MKIGRNDPCHCGSGKKYKKCCLDKKIVPLDVRLMPYEQYEKPEPHIDFVKSLVHQGYRMRTYANKIWPRPAKETLHEFIIYNLMATYGQTWYDSQKNLNPVDQHILYKWYQSYKAWSKLNSTEENRNAIGFGAMPTGDVQALATFAYDVFCLQAFFLFPDFFVKRLRNRQEFQGAKYEVTVAAVMKRAGYEIEFLDSKIKSEKHCDFIVTNKYSKVKIGVEAKSRRRAGILNERGQTDDAALLRGDIENLLNDACQQKPNKIPYFIFIDLNMQPFDEGNPFEKQWFKDLKVILDKRGSPSLEKPDPFNVLFLTNLSYYYGGNSGITPRGNHFTSITQFPEVPLINFNNIHDAFSNPHITEVIQSLNRYTRIPELFFNFVSKPRRSCVFPALRLTLS
jgi:hypothetical protein